MATTPGPSVGPRQKLEQVQQEGGFNIEKRSISSAQTEETPQGKPWGLGSYREGRHGRTVVLDTRALAELGGANYKGPTLSVLLPKYKPVPPFLHLSTSHALVLTHRTQQLQRRISPKARS